MVIFSFLYDYPRLSIWLSKVIHAWLFPGYHWLYIWFSMGYLLSKVIHVQDYRLIAYPQSQRCKMPLMHLQPRATEGSKPAL